MKSFQVLSKSKIGGTRVGGVLQQRNLSFSPRKNVRIAHAAVGKEHEHLFSEDCLKFVRSVAGEMQPRWRAVLAQRKNWWASNATASPNLSLRHDTSWIREDQSWKGPVIVPELKKRWVEITGPAGDAKMVINALNSGANCYMADLEDSQAPTWAGMVQGQQNLFDATRGQLTFQSKDKSYKVNGSTPSLLVRARGLHMVEQHVVDETGRAVPAALFDIATYLFHNAATIIAKGGRPMLYQPKLESYEEAVLIHDMVQQMEKKLGIPYGTCRITALIETLPGILQAEEIGFGLGAYWAGLNCGRWDYIFSVMKVQGKNSDHIFPDRSHLTMDKPFLKQYMQRIVQVAHSRGVHAMGGMSAFLPVSSMSEEEAKAVMVKVLADKTNELAQGCDGAWVAHPAMVKPIQDLFHQTLKGADNQITATTNLTANTSDPYGFATAPTGGAGFQYSEEALRDNISVSIQYIASWLSGSGAVAIKNLMEDMATAEISRTQLWTWYKHNQVLSSGARTRDAYPKFLEEEVRKLQHDIEGYSTKLSTPEKTEKIANILKARELLHSLVTDPELTQFIQDKAMVQLNDDTTKPLPLKSNFVAMQFDRTDQDMLRGSMPDITLNGKLSIIRGKNFTDKMYKLREDGIVPHGSFIGTPTGHGARNVVEGGLGLSWPYIGGWELNARGLNIGMPMPDTLSVNFTEQGDLARVINNFLEMGDRVQMLEMHNKLEAVAKLPVDKQAEARAKIEAGKVDYLTQPMLADLEQGWGDPKKVYLSVIRCLQNGVNIMHIEDQYSLKRCGHLGGKGLDDLHGWIITMKAANLAASLFDGVERDGPNVNCNFVARTDALSAEFIQYSNNMHDPTHPDHPFIDWDRGFTPDGRYLYLKKGKNPLTGRKFGLEHSARRCAEIVKLGLASHVWMETPDANVADAWAFMELTNEHLAPHGLFARGLYNHSPSFVWDVSFFIESTELAGKVATFIKEKIMPLKPAKHSMMDPSDKAVTFMPKSRLDGEEAGISLEKARWMVKNFLRDNGDRVRGDYNFSDDYISQILGNGLDLACGEEDWKDGLDRHVAMLTSLGPSLQSYKAKKELDRILGNGYKPLRHITNVIVAQRLKNFKDRLSDHGFEVHLCTLPLYPSDAMTASKLARGMTETGIHDFVINQRAARKYQDQTGKLTSFFHQKATGSGWESNLNKIVGTSNTNILHGSTEVADQEKEESLKKGGTGPSTYVP